ncbi:MAG: ACT domain-containing protein [Ignavibacteriales bacterium]
MRLSEDEIRKITLTAIEELGEKASPELVKSVVQRSVSRIENSGRTEKEASSGRVILTAYGINSTGIVSSITRALSDANCDLQDISQKIMQEFFTLIILIDITNSSKDLKELQEEMSGVAEKLKIKIFMQHEDLFRFMHRI